MQAPFIPKHLRQWKPEHMRGPVERRCHWCANGPHAIGKMRLVLELPMRYYFCSEGCCEAWGRDRHDADAVEWLKLGAGERAKILREIG
jgi:hypothetical protein|tara:strand:+ start:1372 stop:1638 length:267 start_codon:yes stop_codon:yes gene_type:complete